MLVGNFSHLSKKCLNAQLRTARAFRHPMQHRKKTMRQRCSGHLVRHRCNTAKKERDNGVSEIFRGTDAALQKNSEATVFWNMDGGTDAALQKKSEATVFLTFSEEPMQHCKKIMRQRCSGHLVRQRCNTAKQHRGNDVFEAG